jgi:alpha-tubulin suppressor-like RCC1 family protein
LLPAIACPGECDVHRPTSGPLIVAERPRGDASRSIISSRIRVEPNHRVNVVPCRKALRKSIGNPACTKRRLCRGRRRTKARIVAYLAVATLTGACERRCSDSVQSHSSPSSSRPPPMIEPPAKKRTYADVAQLRAGHERTCAIMNDGRLLCWGAIFDGAAASPHPSAPPGVLYRVRDVALEGPKCVVASDGDISCWGRNAHGEVGAPTVELCPNGPKTVTCATTPVRVTEVPPAIDVATGGDRACAVTEKHEVYCWGSGRYGGLGFQPDDECDDGPCARTPTRVPELGDVSQITLGDGFACVLKLNGSVWCWGNNDFGTLGRGSFSKDDYRPEQVTDLDEPTAVAAGTKTELSRRFGRCSAKPRPVTVDGAIQAMALGGDTTCVLAGQGSLYCWGSNFDGWLGFSSRERCLDWPCELTPRRVSNIPRLRAVANSGSHICALVDAGGTLCWGRWSSGELGFSSNRCRRDGPAGCVEPPTPVPMLDEW